ncbi:hypothetical protein ASC77_19915 [Nocardioides sp. Root1257]|uniref:type II toxin-antitoxin system HipA family toxin n=1 Tax=unclassified Nocardioides TaxID=2615069 RepID=UPI0006FF1A0A|nr:MULTISPECIES: type II toxin-antitoxin system HipA family toxin [unclassified Nocardioides]KQW45050.1 hypothetical protein ASC77_19915 [Nocardioides sp. Root1257]KRC45946.1 hypothetical protein ASE24_15305 [Nocardioides sp. Root224]
MPATKVPLVEVDAWDRWVGRLAQDPDTGFYAFAYTPQWQATGIELAPLHMPLRAEPYQFPGLSVDTFGRLPALFADALPDSFGSAVVDAAMAERGLDRRDVTALDRLAYAGAGGMGALAFRPQIGPTPAEATTIQVADLVVAARRILDGDASTDAPVEGELRQLVQVGASAGGARPKAAVLYNKETGQVRSQLAPREPGFVDYLLKLDGVSDLRLEDPVGEVGAPSAEGRVEFAYYLMAIDAGITMVDTELLLEGSRAHFMTRRFDRGPEGERHHVLTLCALAHLDVRLAGAHSYDQYLDTVAELGLGAEAMAQAYRRMVFNVAAVNRDDHTKNLAFLLREHGQWELAPAYDLTYTNHAAPAAHPRHQMRVNGRTEGITLSDLYAVGNRHEVSENETIVGNVLHAIGQWHEYATRAGIPLHQAEQIADDMTRSRPR